MKEAANRGGLDRSMGADGLLQAQIGAVPGEGVVIPTEASSFEWQSLTLAKL